MSKDKPEEVVAELMEPTVVRAITEAEVQQQVATARKFRRSITEFKKQAIQMIREDAKLAEDCVYAIPRGGKIIKGPSIRLAEIVAQGWGNLRAACRIIAIEEENIVAQGVCHDLETNVAISREVRRRIVDKNGKRYNVDGTTFTGNAAAAIALRNAIFTLVPRTFVTDLLEEAEKVAKGDVATLPARRKAAIEFVQKEYGIPSKRVCAVLEVPGIDDIGLDQLLTLRQTIRAIKDQEVTAAEAFKRPEGLPSTNGEPTQLRKMGAAKPKPEPEPESRVLAEMAEDPEQPEPEDDMFRMPENEHELAPDEEPPAPSGDAEGDPAGLF